jgi:hypothetical protein
MFWLIVALSPSVLEGIVAAAHATTMSTPRLVLLTAMILEGL